MLHKGGVNERMLFGGRYLCICYTKQAGQLSVVQLFGGILCLMIQIKVNSMNNNNTANSNPMLSNHRPTASTRVLRSSLMDNSKGMVKYTHKGSNSMPESEYASWLFSSTASSSESSVVCSASSSAMRQD